MTENCGGDGSCGSAHKQEEHLLVCERENNIANPVCLSVKGTCLLQKNILLKSCGI